MMCAIRSKSVFVLIGLLAFTGLPTAQTKSQNKQSQKAPALRAISAINANLPSEWFKGWVSRVSPDGKMASGQCFTKGESGGLHEWSWSSSGGFKIGSTLPDNQRIDETEPTDGLKAWNLKHGISWANPGVKLGSHRAMHLSATSASEDWSIVVGKYSRQLGPKETDEDAISGDKDGKEFAYVKRGFLSSSRAGRFDIGDLVAPVVKVTTKATGEYSCAISSDGQQVAIAADKLYLVKLSKGT